MARTITRSYDTYDAAVVVVKELEGAGIAPEKISIVGSPLDVVERDATEGAQAGGLVGGGAGLLAALSVIAIPGIGPVFGAGWLMGGAAVGAIAGAAAGSLIGALTGAGVSESDAHYYAETVRRGGSVVSARLNDEQAPQAEEIMDRSGPIAVDARRAEYEREGWTRFDERAGPYHSQKDLSGVVS